MTTIVDPRVIAHALQMGTDDLALVLTQWAGEALPTVDFDSSMAEPTSLEYFDECVDRARSHLVAAHEAYKAWLEDNPDDGDLEREFAEEQSGS